MVLLMLKYGLMVSLVPETASGATCFLVPALLREGEPMRVVLPAAGGEGGPASFVLHFSLDDLLAREAVCTPDLQMGFLPSGLFSRILGNLISLAHTRPASSSSPRQGLSHTRSGPGHGRR